MRTPLGIALLGLLLCAPFPARAYVMIDGSARAGLDSWAVSGNSVDSSQLSFDGGLTDHVYEIYGYLGNAIAYEKWGADAVVHAPRDLLQLLGCDQAHEA